MTTFQDWERPEGYGNNVVSQTLSELCLFLAAIPDTPIDIPHPATAFTCDSGWCMCWSLPRVLWGPGAWRASAVWSPRLRSPVEPRRLPEHAPSSDGPHAATRGCSEDTENREKRNDSCTENWVNRNKLHRNPCQWNHLTNRIWSIYVTVLHTKTKIIRNTVL